MAFGAFGGGLFVASPCVMGVVVWGVKRCGGARQSVLGVCVWGQLRAAPRRGFSLSAAVAFGVPAAVAVLRRFAEALRGGRRGPAAPPRAPFCWPAQSRLQAVSRAARARRDAAIRVRDAVRVTKTAAIFP